MDVDPQKSMPPKTDWMRYLIHELTTPIAISREEVVQVLEGLHGKITSEQEKALSIALKHLDRLAGLVQKLPELPKKE